MALKDDLTAEALSRAAQQRKLTQARGLTQARNQARNPRREEMINNFAQRALTEQARSRTQIKPPRGLERRRRFGVAPSSIPRYLH